MHTITKKILRDERNRPVAVQIPYDDWLLIEDALQLSKVHNGAQDLSRYAGTIALREDPLDYQRRIREEWD